MRFDILSDLGPANELSSAFLDAVRRAAPFHARGKAASSVLKSPTPETSIRVNRVGGPFGHLTPGADFHGYRLLMCNRLVTGAQPRQWWATVIVCVQQQSGAIVSLPCFYVGTRRGSRAAVVTPPMHAVPRQGFVGRGRDLSGELREVPRSRELVELARRFTATTYDGALLCADLAQARPDIPRASPSAVDKLLGNHQTQLSAFTLAARRPSTRSQGVGPYWVGQRVFARWGVGEDEDWWAATIARANGDGTYAVVYLDGSTDDDSTAARKPAESIRPDVVFHRPMKARTVQELSSLAPDPEEVEDDTPAKMAEHIATRGEQVRGRDGRCLTKICPRS